MWTGRLCRSSPRGAGKALVSAGAMPPQYPHNRRLSGGFETGHLNGKKETTMVEGSLRAGQMTGPLAPYVNQLRAELVRAGYSPSTIRQRQCRIAEFDGGSIPAASPLSR